MGLVAISGRAPRTRGGRRDGSCTCSWRSAREPLRLSGDGHRTVREEAQGRPSAGPPLQAVRRPSCTRCAGAGLASPGPRGSAGAGLSGAAAPEPRADQQHAHRTALRGPLSTHGRAHTPVFSTTLGGSACAPLWAAASPAGGPWPGLPGAPPRWPRALIPSGPPRIPALAPEPDVWAGRGRAVNSPLPGRSGQHKTRSVHVQAGASRF